MTSPETQNVLPALSQLTTTVTHQGAELTTIAQARAAVATKVRAVIVDCLGVAAFEVTEGASLAEDLGADSLDMIEIAVELEGQFEIILDDETVEHAASVKDLVDAVTACLARREAGAT